MSNVKIKFSIEVNDECFAQHSVEYTSTYTMRHPIETDEEKLAFEVINRINQLATQKTLQLQNWEILFDDNILQNGSVISTCGSDFNT